MKQQKIVQRLLENNYECFLVGGAVRDGLLGIIPNDFDYATNARPEQVIKIFPDKKINVVGKRFKVVFVEDIQIATYREDVQHEYYDARHCIPKYADSIYTDLKRRDLTINSMAINMETNEFIDLFGGKEDLSEGIIRFVGNPEDRLKEDPDRCLRACRFLAKISGKFAPETLEVLVKRADYIKYVDPERIRLEIMKALEYDTPSLFFSALQLVGVLKFIFPALADCFNHTGGKYHPETLSDHCLSACDNISPKFILLRLAAVLHDIGKVTAWNPNTGSFIDHETIGGKLVKQYLRKLKFSNEEILMVSNLTHAHMRTCRGLQPKSQRRLQKYLADYNVNPRDYIRLKLADRQANLRNGPNKPTPIKELILNSGIRGSNEPLPLTVRDLAITGGQLIGEFKLNPGPLVGKLQKALLEFVIEEGEEFNTFDKLKDQAAVLLALPALLFK
ncbi:CCA tRNA nucleotidyltransferase [bacterium]|nr:CCA tRNA nucleotidyltransferase [bacterium]